MNKEKLTSGVITLTSDFGDRFALSQLELAVYLTNPHAKLVVLSNEVKPFSVLEGAFFLAKGYKFSPRGDVFAPAAARLSLGESPLNFAEPFDEASIFPYDFEPDQVVHIDAYGNAKLTSSPEALNPGDQLSIDLITGRVILPFCKTFADVPKGALLTYLGSHGTLELARNFGSAAEALQLTVGQRLKICNFRGVMQEGQIC